MSPFGIYLNVLREALPLLNLFSKGNEGWLSLPENISKPMAFVAMEVMRWLNGDSGNKCLLLQDVCDVKEWEVFCVERARLLYGAGVKDWDTFCADGKWDISAKRAKEGIEGWRALGVL